MRRSQPKTPAAIRAVTRTSTETMIENLSPEWQIWKTFVPEKTGETELLHLRIEQPLVVTLIPESPSLQTNRPHRPRVQRTLRSVIWLFKIMVIPIAATTGLLWLLLLYLLKNAELLEAQKHRPDADAVEEKADVKSLEGRISFATLPRAFSSDVELISASQDGQIVVSVGLHNEITVWNLKTQTHTSIDATNLLLRAASTSHVSPTLTTLAVEKSGEHFAVGTGTGIIAVWRIDKATISPFPHLSLESSSTGVADLQFGNPLGSRRPNGGTSRSEPSSPDSDFEVLVVLLATFDNGVAVKWAINEFATVSYLSPTQDIPVSNVSLVRVAPDDQVLVAYSFNDASLELIETGDTLPIILPKYHIRPGTQGDCVSQVHACRSELNGTARLVIATATESGVVSLWDGSTGECISVLEEARGRVTNLRISPVRCETCHYCGQLPLESVSIAFSIDYVVRFFRLYVKDQTRRCSCTRTQLKHMSSSDHMGRRSRSNSGTSQIGSPRIPRARLATAFKASAFPVSGHGIHSRRASEKETGRKSSEILTAPFAGEDHDANGHLLSSLDGASTAMHAPPSFWRNAVVIPVTNITCERGGWNVSKQNYVGIRRKPRSQDKTQSGTIGVLQNSSSSYGLTRSTLERWELWMFDPALARIHCSALTSLTQKQPENEGTPPTPTSTTSSADPVARLPFTRVSPIHITSSCVLAGFGNTIGVFHLTDC
jgi:WD40 repeat protein